MIHPVISCYAIPAARVGRGNGRKANHSEKS